jgi:magnesium transporter
MTNEIMKENEKFEILLENMDYKTIASMISKMQAVEAAEYLNSIPKNQIVNIVNLFDKEKTADIVSRLNLEKQAEVANELVSKELSNILEFIAPDDRADLFKKLTAEVQNDLLPYLTKKTREDIIRLSSYPEGSAGSVMSSNFASIINTLSIEKALEKVRHDAPSKETIYYIYVVDSDMHLIGFIFLEDLILANLESSVTSIMKTKLVFADVFEDQESVAKKIEKYDLIAIPVVNKKNQLVGIVTHDDAIDILRQEQTEDLEKFMGITGEHKAYSYLNKPSWVHFKNRAYWLISLAIVGLLSGVIVHQYSYVLRSLMIVALFMPMMADTGGNSGSQSATVIVRALAIGEITIKDWLKVIWKETKISAMLAFVLGLLAFIKVIFLTTADDIPEGFNLLNIALVIGLALALQVFTATIMGALLPIIAKKFKADPAVIASPALTTLVDISGMLIYFGLVSLLLT